MDEPHHNGLPAHVAIEPPWSVSYAADWRGVVEAAEASAQVLKPTALGVVTVPSANESQKMIRVFEETGITARRLAAASRIKLSICQGFLPFKMKSRVSLANAMWLRLYVMAISLQKHKKLCCSWLKMATCQPEVQ